jgi:hypothetical protein
VLGVYPADIPDEEGKIVVLSVGDYGGSNTRWLYHIRKGPPKTWELYRYDGSGAPEWVDRGSWILWVSE